MRSGQRRCCLRRASRGIYAARICEQHSIREWGVAAGGDCGPGRASASKLPPGNAALQFVSISRIRIDTLTFELDRAGWAVSGSGHF